MITLEQPFKRGDTFRMPFSVDDREGQPVDISAWGIESRLRHVNTNLIQNMTVTRPNGGSDGLAELSATAEETAGWPRGTAIMDIRVTDQNGDVYTTLDIAMTVTESQSRG